MSMNLLVIFQLMIWLIKHQKTENSPAQYQRANGGIMDFVHSQSNTQENQDKQGMISSDNLEPAFLLKNTLKDP